MPISLSPTFIIGHIHIGSVTGASCVNMGNNRVTDFESNHKLNQGFGNVSGDNNLLRDTKSVLDDSDFMDMMNGDLPNPNWMKEITAITSGKDL